MYKEWLTGERIRPSTRGSRSLYEEAESDRARVLYSASFRRLQRKTQVFPLEDNAAIRTRLTHSLEVAHVGRFLAGKIIEKAKEFGKAEEWGLRDETARAFQVMTEVACLLHDVGNPPFGHFGEVAISKWCEESAALLNSDLVRFDGNPQGFRIICRLAGVDSAGMNLTIPQLAATLKYPSLKSENDLSKNFKKFGVFSTESSRLATIREKLGIKPEQRFCIAYIMEAADDISYCLSDIEDGVEKKLIAVGNFFEEIEKSIKDSAVKCGAESIFLHGKAAADKANGSVDKIVSFRAAIISKLVESAAQRYVEMHDRIADGSLHELLGEKTPEGDFLKQLKEVVSRTLYSSDQIVKLELAGLRVVGGILETLSPLLEVDSHKFSQLLKGERVKGLDVQRRLVALLAESHKAAYSICLSETDGVDELLKRGHLLVDLVSGMTDPFAVETYQRVSGSARL